MEEQPMRYKLIQFYFHNANELIKLIDKFMKKKQFIKLARLI